MFGILIPPSPWTGSTKIATTLLLFSATFFIASISLKGTRTNPSTRGSKPAWTLRFPVAVRVARVLPWKAESATIITGFSIFFLCPCSLAIFIAHSFVQKALVWCSSLDFALQLLIGSNWRDFFHWALPSSFYQHASVPVHFAFGLIWLFATC